ncbi:hypothetical protein [Natronolimnohabitans innermongolicus]|uniref:C2H2-type domain-containing protein n=1 Tax=Natronolimnohabitans innermongolicus JCM 12255 TaxID=1227499 RepID=L9X2C8_9EURY|nr:hypothetical protein [Natronolimnohabitans innermongolicus]ELY54743.1 hypothetical protein C493_12259 [Natronolimnohabitans innermongolicus JCM 12255]
MTTHCPYCGDRVPDESYEDHLRRTHTDELTRIDARRVGTLADEPTRRRPVIVVGIGVIVVVFALGYGVLFFGDDTATSSAAVQPDPTSQIHEHGTISVQYDGAAVEFNDPQFIEADDCFHFHAADDAAVWHAHCEDVTIEYALETLGMELTAERFVIDDAAYAEADGDEISVTVDGDAVDPQTYVLEGVESVADARGGSGDDIEVVVESGG